MHCIWHILYSSQLRMLYISYKCSLYNKRHLCIVYGIYCTHRNSECYTYHTNAACIIKGMYALYMAYIVLIATQNVMHIIHIHNITHNV